MRDGGAPSPRSPRVSSRAARAERAAPGGLGMMRRCDSGSIESLGTSPQGWRRVFGRARGVFGVLVMVVVGSSAPAAVPTLKSAHAAESKAVEIEPAREEP